MIEQQLLNYGVLGLWTLTLLVEKFTKLQKITNVINRNTEALNKNSYVMSRLYSKLQK